MITFNQFINIESLNHMRAADWIRLGLPDGFGAFAGREGILEQGLDDGFIATAINAA